MMTAMLLLLPIVIFIYSKIVGKTIAFNGYQYLLLGLPFIFIAWPIALYKDIKAGTGGRTKWKDTASVKNTPSWFGILGIIYCLIIVIINWKKINNSWANIPLILILPGFLYLSATIFLSSFLEKKK